MPVVNLEHFATCKLVVLIPVRYNYRSRKRSNCAALLLQKLSRTSRATKKDQATSPSEWITPAGDKDTVPTKSADTSPMGTPPPPRQTHLIHFLRQDTPYSDSAFGGTQLILIVIRYFDTVCGHFDLIHRQWKHFAFMSANIHNSRSASCNVTWICFQLCNQSS